MSENMPRKNYDASKYAVKPYCYAYFKSLNEKQANIKFVIFNTQ